MMIKIKNLQVKVTYRVGLGNIKAPKKVIKELYKAIDNGHSIDINDDRYPVVADWLIDNIQEKDCMDWECEIEDIS